MLTKIAFGTLICLIGFYTLIKKETTFVVGYDFNSDDSKDDIIYDKQKICHYWGIVFILIGSSNYISILYDFFPNFLLSIVPSIMIITGVLCGVFFSYKKDIFKK